MREETRTYKLFKFSELSEEVQEKVLDKHRDWNVDGFEWWDGVYEGAYENLKEKGFLNCKIWFSGFWSQGDGACFDCDSFDLDKLLAALKDRVNPDKFKKYQKYISKLSKAGYIGVGIRTVNHHYSHAETRKLELDTNVYKSTPRLLNLVNQFEEDLEELRSDISYDIYKSLEKEYEYLTSDEAVKDSIEANELEFLENGKVYR